MPNTVTKLSVLIPVYNEAECLSTLYDRLKPVLRSLDCDHEILFVNDGSQDASMDLIRGFRNRDDRVAFLDLSRNFGKEAAMAAGIDHVTGDALCILDADLQDPPELIPEMLGEIRAGYDDVFAQRTSRDGESFMKKASAKAYYKILDSISPIPIQKDTGDYRIFSGKAITALREIKEHQRNMKGLFSYIGFKKKPVFFRRSPRAAGKTKWNYFKLLNLAVHGLTSFSVFPLRMISLAGVIVAILSFIYLNIIVFGALFFKNPVAGYPSIMAAILFLGGLQLLAIGIIGEYLGVIFSETKKRPHYFINEYSGPGGTHESKS